MLRQAVLLLLLTSTAGGAAWGRVLPVLSVEGAIDPPTASYILRGLRYAERQGAPVVLIQMDTPGGLMDSMRQIVKAMLASPVPVVVYVAPRGARAASAGCFIVMAADVAAMAPQTSIGAAHPVEASGGAVPEKVTNDAAAQIRGLATRHGRNVQWAEDAVRKSASATEGEALRLGVVELVAPSLESLIQKLHGRQVRGRALRLQGVPPEPLRMTLRERALHGLANPNITMILFLLALYGLITEVTHPGAIFPGVVGAISLILALYSFAVFSLNVAGLLFMALAVFLFLADLFLPGHGVLSIVGGICLAASGFLLFEGSAMGVPASVGLVISLALFTTAFFVFAIGAGLRAQRRAVMTGREELIGSRGVAKTDLSESTTGMVLLRGEWWRAVAEEPVPAGESVVVTGVEGLTLRVRKDEY